MRVCLMTGGADTPYALGLLNALVEKGIQVDFIANDEMSRAKVAKDKRVNCFNLRGDQNPSVSTLAKLIRVLKYYIKLIRYSFRSEAEIFHILWFNKFLVFDRTLLNIYYKCLGKKLVFTAHNIDETERDGGGNFLTKVSLKILYRLVDHVFVHTPKMKSEIVDKFQIEEGRATVIPFGINNTTPQSGISRKEARAKVHLQAQDKVLLFFGLIAPYKGLEFLLYALDQLRKSDPGFKLIIAGQVKDCQPYWRHIEDVIEKLQLQAHLVRRIEFVPDTDVEAIFMSADVLVLPYRFVYQSGVLFLSYSFGLPVIVTDVGSLRDEVEEGKTGMICKPEDASDLARGIREYFEGDIYKHLNESMKYIRARGNDRYAWSRVCDATHVVYQALLAKDQRTTSC